MLAEADYIQFMPKFKIEYPSIKDADEAYKTIKGFLSKGSEIAKLDAKAQCTFDDSKKSASISGSQFKAEMNVASTGPQSQILITVDLPFLLMPFKGKIEESLVKMLNKHLA